MVKATFNQDCDFKIFAKVCCELYWIQLPSLGWALPCICFREDFFSFIQGYCSCIDIMASGDMPVTMLSMGPCPPYPATVSRVTGHVWARVTCGRGRVVRRVQRVRHELLQRGLGVDEAHLPVWPLTCAQETIITSTPCQAPAHCPLHSPICNNV